MRDSEVTHPAALAASDPRMFAQDQILCRALFGPLTAFFWHRAGVIFASTYVYIYLANKYH
jgi:hypothetical protein